MSIFSKFGRSSKPQISKWRKQADKNNPDALYNLGNAYFHGKEGVDPDVEKAVNYWQRADDLGHLDAKHEIGHGLFTGVEVEGKIILEKNVKKAIEKWETIMQQGLVNPNMHYCLGITYLYGDDEIEPDIALGINHLHDAVVHEVDEIHPDLITEMEKQLLQRDLEEEGFKILKGRIEFIKNNANFSEPLSSPEEP